MRSDETIDVAHGRELCPLRGFVQKHKPEPNRNPQSQMGQQGQKSCAVIEMLNCALQDDCQDKSQH
jgi:hypothetical protein